MFRLVLDHHFRQCEDTPSPKEHSLPALFFVEASDVGSDRVIFFGTQNDIGHAGVREAEKNIYGELIHRRHTADVHEIWRIWVRARTLRIGVNLMASAAHRLSKVPTNAKIGWLCAG